MITIDPLSSKVESKKIVHKKKKKRKIFSPTSKRKIKNKETKITRKEQSYDYLIGKWKNMERK